MIEQFQSLVKKDSEIQKALGDSSTITLDDVPNLSEKIADYVSDTLKEWVTVENMPNQTMYWHVLKDTVEPLIRQAYELTIQICKKAQANEDESNNIHVAVKVPPFNEDRVKSFMNRLMQFGGGGNG